MNEVRKRLLTDQLKAICRRLNEAENKVEELRKAKWIIVEELLKLDPNFKEKELNK